MPDRTLVVLQPGYLPWIGFFDQMRRSDVFVYYDDVQFDWHGWRNRNRIKMPGGPLWLTVPVVHGGDLSTTRVIDARIDRSVRWAGKHVRSVRQYYAKAPFLRDYLPALEELLQRDWTHIAALDIALVELMAGWLSLTPNVHRSSALGVPGSKSERLLNLCRHFGATRYLSGDAAREYLDVEAFTRAGVAVEWQQFPHPVYPQLHGEFVPYLSALDLLLNCGGESASILERRSAHS